MSDEKGQTSGNRPKTVTIFTNPIRYARIIAEVNQYLKRVAGGTFHRIFPRHPETSGPETVSDPVLTPEVAPHFEIQCGEKACDQVKIDECVSLCVVARNPYTNVILQDLMVKLTVVDGNGNPLPPLADGSPAVIVIPGEGLSFGDLAPDLLTAPAAVAREAVLCSRGAKKGDYFIQLSYDFSIAFMFRQQDQFELPLVRS